ncbi:tRNA pseudouridine(55) synthase TruB [Oenococcus alcoholitolerans]|uniref:tRNA pseudouridine(55) synthase TruB n=1 Tax=Oenococcus alcoholitolerans TaxID=931074 RepID=UPI003F70CF76
MYHGLILIDKPSGMTSFDVVAKVRHKLGQKKVGHSGTLDPSVTGLLVIALGKATKLVNYLQNNRKIYRGEMVLGIKTDTQDLDGQIIDQEKLINEVPLAKLEENFSDFIGSYEQLPPMYSAVKLHGQKLYELARQGKVVERKSRLVDIDRFSLSGNPIFDPQKGLEYINFIAKVSKGTYIRTLVEDFGARLSLPASMVKLRRIEADGFSVRSACKLDDFLASDDCRKFIIPIEKSLLNYPKVPVSDDDWRLILNGGWLKLADISANVIRIFYSNTFQAIYQFDEKSGLYKPRTMLIHENN